ncbi:MAG TPA: hypothetical protein VHD56_01430, partial [Tepidisphaeraceae bacterium]|nr:hypothetical protein [Tepidisphaeraceae bacterium]
NLTQLLGTLTYRGHAFGGLEWMDRYSPELMEAAEHIHGSDIDALMAACRWTHQFYLAPAKYGTTFTLRDAIENKKLDCVRATDMISAIFRDAGRSKLGFVWWSAGTAAHSISAYLERENDQPHTLMVDGLNPPDQPELWPDAYFHGHAWPPTFKDYPPPYSAELYVRGIDSYVWAEGYIIRGASAGMLYKAAIPYLPTREQKSVSQVYGGPFPQ